MKFSIKVRENLIGELDGSISDRAAAGTIPISSYWRGAYPFYPNKQGNAWNLFDTENDTLIATDCKALPAFNPINPYLFINGIKPSPKKITE